MYVEGGMAYLTYYKALSISRDGGNRGSITSGWKEEESCTSE